MKIVQISSVLETRYTDATIYGLGDDGYMYYWGRTKTTTIQHDEPDEDGEIEHDEHEWGWKRYEP